MLHDFPLNNGTESKKEQNRIEKNGIINSIRFISRCLNVTIIYMIQITYMKNS